MALFLVKAERRTNTGDVTFSVRAHGFDSALAKAQRILGEDLLSFEFLFDSGDTITVYGERSREFENADMAEYPVIKCKL